MVTTRLFLVCAALLVACREPSPLPLQGRIDAAEDGARFVLPAGRIERLVVRRAVLLEGGPETRLSGLEVGGTGIHLRNLVVDGPVEVASGARLDASGGELSGGLRIAAGGTASLGDERIVCAPDATGVRVEGTLHASNVVVTGPCQRSIDVGAGGHASLARVTLEGARLAAIRVVDARLSLTDMTATVEAADGEGVALFAARAAIEGRQVTLRGGDQALLARSSTSRLEGLVIERAASSGAAFVGGSATLTDVSLTGPFRHAGLFLAERSTVVANRVVVKETGIAGVLVLRAEARLDDLRVEGARVDRQGDFGHGISLEEATATLGSVAVAGAEGAALYASQSRVEIAAIRAENVGAGLAVTTRSSAKVQSFSVVAPATLGAAVWNGSSLVLGSGAVDATYGLVVCPEASLDPGTVRLPERARLECTLNALPRAWRRVARERNE